MSFLAAIRGLIADLEELRARVDALDRSCYLLDRRSANLTAWLADLERSCQNDPPGGQGGSTFDPPGLVEGPAQAAETADKNPQAMRLAVYHEALLEGRNIVLDEPEIFPKKISGEE